MHISTRTLLLLSSICFTGCPEPTTFIPGGDSDDTDVDSDTDSDTDDDTDTDTKCSPDEDQDGYCPPEDCDDTSIFVNPAWDENPNNDIDDNCDGRIDEQFAGVLALEIDALKGPAIVHIDSLGKFKGAYGLSEPAAFQMASLDRDLESFVGWDGASQLWRFDKDGNVELIAEIPEDWEWLDEEGEEDPPPGVGADVGVHPDGYYLIAMGDRLAKFDESGAFSIVAQWDCVEADMSHEFCPVALSVDSVTGVTWLFGYFGGVGTWSAEEGVTVINPSNPEEPGPSYVQAHHESFDTSYAMATFVREDGQGNYGVFRWNNRDKEMRLQGEWPLDQLKNAYTPNAFSIESERGDFYFSANSATNGQGSWENQIWRMTADGSFTTQLYSTPNGENDKNAWYAGVVYYTQD